MFDQALPWFGAQTARSPSSGSQALAETFLAAPPSGKIEMALADLEVIEGLPNYAIDMETWHAPIADDGRCLVCLAGAVMASRHPIEPHQTYVGPLPADGPQEFALSEHWDDLFYSLDEFRAGHVEAFLTLEGSMPRARVEAFAHAESPAEPFGCFPGHVHYEDDAAAFKYWARGIASKLRLAGY